MNNKNNLNNNLSIETAMEKYFYPNTKKIVNNYDLLLSEINSKTNENKSLPKRKRTGLRLGIETVASLLTGCGVSALYAYSVGLVTLMPVAIASAVSSVVVFGALETFSFVNHKIKQNKIQRKDISKLNSAQKQLELEKMHVQEILKQIESFKSYTNLDNFTSSNIEKTMYTIAETNNTIFSLIDKMYSNNETIKLLAQKYKNIEDCYKNTSAICADLNLVKKELVNSQKKSLNLPNVFDLEQEKMIYSTRDEISLLFIKNIIPFTQVLNVCYEKTKSQLDEKQAKLKLQKQKEEQLRQEIKKAEFKKENTSYKEFFSQFGIDEELTN